MKILFLILPLILVSCSKDMDLEFPSAKRTEKYKIFKGNHVSSPLETSPIFSVHEFVVRITFIKAQYTLLDQNGNVSADQLDWNKLTGFSDCNQPDAFTGMGAMVGWRWNRTTSQIELAAYVHNNANKTRQVKEFTTVYMNENQPMIFKIAVDQNIKKYTYTIEDPNPTASNPSRETITMDGEQGRGCPGPITGRLISPWFGGNQSAPTDIEVLVEYL